MIGEPKFQHHSNYSTCEAIILFVIGFFLIIMIIVGNFLVIWAVIKDNSLKNLQNWFIASLAFADILVGIVVVPFSLTQEVLGQWLFGYYWCQFHAALDVFLCTSSILNLCLISLDRYWSVTRPTTYIRIRTEGKVLMMILSAWVFSLIVSIPPLLYPPWSIPYRSPEETTALNETETKTCILSEDAGYILYSSIGSFYVPSCIMVFVYFNIYFAIRARTRRHNQNYNRKKHEQVSSKEEATDGKIELSVIVQPEQEENPTQEIETVGTVVKAREEKEMRSKINWCCWLNAIEEEKDVEKNSKTRELVPDRKKIARMKERRACVILGLIMFCFILSWLPFFLLYCLTLSYPMCKDGDESSFCILDWMFSFAFWLGYSNSALNPIIYTVFNEDFRRAFIKILTKC